MKAGSIVVCVDDRFSKYAKNRFTDLPVRNRHYMVREIIPNLQARNGPPGVVLEEIRGEQITFTTYYGAQLVIEVHFKMNRFKEVLPPTVLEEAMEQVCNEPELVPA